MALVEGQSEQSPRNNSPREEEEENNHGMHHTGHTQSILSSSYFW